MIKGMCNTIFINMKYNQDITELATYQVEINKSL